MRQTHANKRLHGSQAVVQAFSRCSQLAHEHGRGAHKVLGGGMVRCRRCIALDGLPGMGKPPPIGATVPNAGKPLAGIGRLPTITADHSYMAWLTEEVACTAREPSADLSGIATGSTVSPRR